MTRGRAAGAAPDRLSRADSLSVVALTVARRDHHKESVALPVDAQQRLPLGLSRQAVKVCHGIHRLAIDTFDDIAWLYAALSGRTAGIKFADHYAPDAWWQT